MSETICKKNACCQTDLLLGDFSDLSLVGGDYPGGNIVGNPESTFIVDCPPGIVCIDGQYPVVVTVPEYNYPYGPPEAGEPIVIRVPCGTAEIVRTYPAGTPQQTLTTALFEMMHECQEDEAIIKATPNTAGIATLYANAESPFTCNGKLFSASIGAPFIFNSNKTVTIPSGTWTTYNGQAAADAMSVTAAEERLAEKIAAGTVQCGYWNTEQTVECIYGPDETIEAFTHFSAVSQAAADQLAIDAAEAECPQGCSEEIDALTWVVTATPVNPGTGSGVGSSLEWNVPTDKNGLQLQSSGWVTTGVNCVFNAVYTTQGTTSIHLTSAGGATGNLWKAVSQPPGTYNVSAPISIPSGSPMTISLLISCGGGANGSVGTALIGPTP